METRSGAAVEAIRARLEITQEALAARLGMSPSSSYVNRIIKGRRLPGDDFLDRLQRAVGLSDEEAAELRRLRDEDRRAWRRARQRPLEVVDRPPARVTDPGGGSGPVNPAKLAGLLSEALGRPVRPEDLSCQTAPAVFRHAPSGRGIGSRTGSRPRRLSSARRCETLGSSGLSRPGARPLPRRSISRA